MSTKAEVVDESSRQTSGWRIPLALYPLLGVACFAFGLLPWLITGMRLPLQNLWAMDVSPEQMPIGLLPFSQYAIALLLGLVIVGAAITGWLARQAERRIRRWATLFSGVGWLIATTVTIVQTARVMQMGLADDTRADYYLAALVGIAVIAVVVGMVVLMLLALAGHAGASIGATFAAIAAGVWANGLILPFGAVGSDIQTALLHSFRWLPAVGVGIVLAWCGLNSVGKIAAWVVDLLLVWVIPAGLTAVAYAAGSRVLIRVPSEAVAAGISVFGQALTTYEVSGGFVVVAFVIGVLGLLLRRVSGRTRRQPRADQY